MTTSTRSGFSLIELVVVMLIMSILTGVVAPRVVERQKNARDARRMADIRTVQEAVEQYKLDNGIYPAANKNTSFGDWDVSHDGDFISALVDEGYLREPVYDPLNDATHHFRYYVYDQGSYGCAGDAQFYVLGVRNFETSRAQADHVGHMRCSGRDWGDEFDYVTGGGASYE